MSSRSIAVDTVLNARADVSKKQKVTRTDEIKNRSNVYFFFRFEKIAS